jgi:hypothetical protein
MNAMTDPRAVVEYRIAAADLKVGDIVNTSPGGPDDWQRVLAVHTQVASGKPEVAGLMEQIGDRYVMVELSDVSAVDNNVYLDDEGTAMVFGSDDEADTAVLEAVGDAADTRTYLYTVHELVTVRGGQ